jgi:hypothetical protein
VDSVSDEVKILKLYRKGVTDSSFTLLTSWPEGTTVYNYTYVETAVWQTIEWRVTGVDKNDIESSIETAARFSSYLSGSEVLGFGEGLYGYAPWDSRVVV